ncbi:hypothetical protein ACFVHB_20170 [Kitasatospora sp. NPDC127111]|uniref:hypothetical protein n=1 Tax=Kitasatospora sp. NPDC127111 TaxID=3345363 RepID=UPI00362F5CED
MDTYISHSSWRREEWKGHPSKEGARRAILYNRGRSAVLTIFRLERGSAGLAYRVVPQEYWDLEFAD